MLPFIASAAAPPAKLETLADRLVVDLAAAGMTHYFGVPGGAIEPLFDALARQTRAGGVRLVPTRSEAAAAFAADGYHRASGRMAVCTGTTGPGTANMLSAIMSAHADRIPLLVLSPQVALAKQGRGALQESSIDGYDLPAVFGPCTRYTSTVTHPAQLPFKLAHALARALTPPHGPVHLALPSDVLRAPAPEASMIDPARIVAAGATDPAAVAEVCAALTSSRAPVLYVGDDAGPMSPRLIDVARALGGLVVTSPAGKRWIGHRDPLYRGVLGFSGNPEAQVAVEDADLIVTFGATFDEFSTNAWTTLSRSRVYAVDSHAEHAWRHPSAKLVLAGVGDVAERLLSAPARAVTMGGDPPARSIRPVPPYPPARPATSGAVHPIELMTWLGEALPDDVVVHVDAGNGFSWSTRYLSRRRPDTYRVAMGLSTMCWAIGASLGAAIATGRRTVCVTGDGAWLMSSLELTVAVEQRLPVTYIVLNDGGLGMVRHGQCLGGAEAIAHDIAPVRFDRIAEACGASGISCSGSRELYRIPQVWLGSDEAGPCVIDVAIDREAVPPMADRVAGLATGVPR